MTMNEFNELVWNYGASGTKVLENCTEREIEVIINTWNDVEFELNNDTEEEKINAMINSYYNDVKYRISFDVVDSEGYSKGQGGFVSIDEKSVTNGDNELLFNSVEEAQEWIEKNGKSWNGVLKVC